MSRFAAFLLLLAPLTSIAADAPSGGHPTEVRDLATDHSAEWQAYLRAQRETNLQRLEQYRDAYNYPQNTVKPGFAHQLLDANGTPCAMAYLFIQSGEDDLIRKTAKSHNDIIIADQDSGPFADWILTSGLTREEVAVIQEPGFEWSPEDELRARENQRMWDHFDKVIGLLRADVEPSIALEMERLGDRVRDEAPPAPPIN